MARIRTTKPEFCVSEPVLECCRDARLFFILLWNFCDDGGVHPYSLTRLKYQIFPADDDMPKDRINELIIELEKNELIKTYTVDDKKYIRILGWKEHQKIDKPTYKYPYEDGYIPVKQSIKTAAELNVDDRDFLTSSRKRKDLKNFLIQRDGNECSYCGSTTRTITVDHIIPRSKEGTDNVDNLVLACRQCNAAKHNKTGNGRRPFDDHLPNGSGDLPEKTNNDQIDQKIINTAKVACGREGNGYPVVNSLSNINIDNICEKNKNDVEINNNVKKRGRKKLYKKWTPKNYEQIPDEIVAGFEQIYKPYLQHKARIEGLCAYANMNGGMGATDTELKQMHSALLAQNHETILKRQAGHTVLLPHISTWINNRRFEDEVDLSTPIQLKPKSTSNKFADNAAKACQNMGGT